MRMQRLAIEQRVFLGVLSCIVPLGLLSIDLLTASSRAVGISIAAVAAALIWVALVAVRLRGRLIHDARTLSTIIEAIRAQDYSIRGASPRSGGTVAELYAQVNMLAQSLREGRETEQELRSILEKVVNQIRVAIMVFDSRDRIQLVNRLASILLNKPAESLIGVEFSDTALSELPPLIQPRLLNHRFPGGEGRWHVSQQLYRNRGRPGRIIFIADLKEVLSEEEAAAWQRLIRVISHEVNNSLTPITSLCQTLSEIVDKHVEGEHSQDIRDGLRVIADRASSLKEFISRYARIARLPEPQKALFPAAELVQRVSRFFASQVLEMAGDVPREELFGDRTQLEQALINLIKNAFEATSDPAQAVHLGCRVRDGLFEFEIADRGPGISNPGNLFVPFYTTKSEGAGIGLALCRQIAAKHYGAVTLENRTDGRGAVARLLLPLPRSQTEEAGR